MAMSTLTATSEVIFRISDGSARKDVRIPQPDMIRGLSLGLRKLMDEEDTNQPIPLEVDPNSDIDIAAVIWILDNLQKRDLGVNPNPETLSRQCALIWKYKCNPDSFKLLGERVQPRSSLRTPSPDEQSTIANSHSPSVSLRSWRGKKNSNTCGQLITIAIVLGLRDILEEEIRNAVWGMFSNVKIAVPLEKDIEG